MRSSHRIALLLMAVLVMCATIQEAAGQAAPTGEVIVAWHVTIAPTWFDPSSAPPQITPFGTLYAIHDALARPMPNQKMGPSLAESWTESPDGLVYEFKLRRGLKFHNGDPLTAEDVKFSFERYKGAGAKELQTRVRAVEIVDPLTVRFRLRRALAGLHDVLRDDRHRGRRRRAQELPDAGRRRRVPQASDRRRALQVREPHTRAWRWCWRPTRGTGGASPTSSGSSEVRA